jgi:tRNA(Ile)-lysidine synthase
MLRLLGSRLVGLEGVSAPVVVACSGGVDSLALLALAAAAGFAPVAVHVDHGLRPGSDAEADVVAGQARHLDVEFVAECVDVGCGPNVEARARDVRYDALERVRAARRACAILVGHTADDLAETVIVNLLRGSASTGLAGMPAVRGVIVRPMLHIRRHETEALCAELGLDPVRDPTNSDTSLLRNWIRLELIPQLCERLDRDLTPVLVRQAGLLRDESEYLDALARLAWPSDASVPAAVLAGLDPVLARRAIRQWLGPPPPTLHEVERVLAVARGERRGTELRGGRRVERSGGVLRLVSGGEAR